MVVPPQSTRIASGRERATSIAVATQLAAAQRQRRGPCLCEADQLAARGHDLQPAAGQRLLGGLEHGQHALALAGEHVDELRRGGQRDRSALEPQPSDDRGDRIAEPLGLAPQLERLGHGPGRPFAVDHRRLGVGAADVEPDHRDRRLSRRGHRRSLQQLRRDRWDVGDSDAAWYVARHG